MSVTLGWADTNNTYKVKTGAGKMSRTGHGTCMSMSSHWAKICLKFGRKLTSKTEMPDDVAMSAAHVKHTRDYKKAPSMGSEKAEVESWHQRFFEALDLEGSLIANGNGPGSLDITSRRGAYVFTIYGPGGGHSMAFWRGSSYSAYYDPNEGQLSCKASIFSSFKRYVKDDVTQAYPNLNEDWWVYRIQAT